MKTTASNPHSGPATSPCRRQPAPAAFRRRVALLSFFAAAILFLVGATTAYADPSGYAYNRALTIDYTQVGATHTGTLPATGFPVLVKLSGSWLKTTTADPTNGRIRNANGYDIVFTAADGDTLLYHEIESYDGTNGSLVAWVRVDSLSKAANTVIYMYYGNGSIASPTASPANVWDSNYSAVWHLDEVVTDETTGGIHYDSTANAQNGTQNNNTNVTGKIVNGQQFDGSGDYISLPSVCYTSTTAWTLEFWVNPSSSVVQYARPFIQAYTDCSTRQITVAWNTSPNRFEIRTSTSGTSGAPQAATGTITNDGATWTHFVWTSSDGGATNTLYVNGQVSSGTASTTPNYDMAGTNYIGRRTASTYSYWTGGMDEVRLSSTARDGDWVITSYNSQNNPGDVGTTGTFYTVGTETGTPASLTQVHARWRNDDGALGGLDAGTGADGAVTISSSQNINTAILGSNHSTYADGIVTTVSSFGSATGGTTLTVASASGLAVNDEVLLINLQGDGTNKGNVGNYEFLEIQSIATNTLTFKTAIQKIYGATTSNLVLTGQDVVIQRVPQWTNVTIQSGGSLIANAWNGTSGGLIVFRATGSVTVNSGGSISATSLGYRGGAGGTTGGGTNGESYDGSVGSGGNDTVVGNGGGASGTSGGGSSSNRAVASPAGTRGGGGGGGNCDGNLTTDGAGGAGGGGYGGGGGGGAGGGGSSNSGGTPGTGGGTGVSGGGGGTGNTTGAGYAGGSAGSAGSGTYPGVVGSGATSGGGGGSRSATATSVGAGGGGGGGTYGVAALTTLFLGSGGGGGGGHDYSTPSYYAGATGGNGGGIIYIIANALSVAGSITSNGGAGAQASAVYGGSSGGGAGGSILIQANSATLGTGLVTASGGATAAASTRAGGGGGGGVGRVRVEADTITGTTTPAYSGSTTPAVSGATWAANEDAKLIGLDKGIIQRVRFLVANAGGLASGAVAYQLQVAPTSACSSGAYSTVPTDASGAWQIVASTYLTDGEAVNNVSPGLTDPTGGAFIAGQAKDAGNATSGITLSTGQFTEIEFALQATDNAAYGQDYCFQLYNGTANQPLDTYTAYAQVKVAAPFAYRKTITIDRTKVSCSTATDFPFMVRISGDANLKSTANGGHVASDSGDDIIFRDSDGKTTLDHEIEKYDGTTGDLIAWVRIPTLVNTTNKVLYMYYGNDTITSATANPTGVWDANYVGVWHLKETSGTQYDSTSYGNNGTPSVTTQGSATGKIDGADAFTGTGNYVSVGTSSWSNLTGTVELWANTASSDTNTRYFFGHTTSPAYASMIQLYTDSTSLNALNLGLGGIHAARTGIQTLVASNWYHIALTWNNGTYFVYVNGLQKATGTYTNVTAIGTADIGNNGNSASRTQGCLGSLDEVHVSNTARDGCWITTSYNNQNSPATFFAVSSEEASPATAVTLLSLTATGQGETVLVGWETAQEINNLGFHLYRGTSPTEPTQRLTDNMIAANPFSLKGKAYSFVDRDVTPGQLYYYWLEDTDTSGKKTLHGPVCVDWDGDGMPDDWEIANGLDPKKNDAGADLDGDGRTNLQEYQYGTSPLLPDTAGGGTTSGQSGTQTNQGEAASTGASLAGVQVVSSDESGITLELRTSAFDRQTLEAGGMTFQRLHVLDYIHGYTQTVGRPELPVKGILIDLPAGKSATLEVLKADSHTLTDFWIYPVPQKASGGAKGGAVTEIFAMDADSYAANAFYPDATARLGETYLFRDQHKLQVLFQPLAFNPATKELRQYDRIRVRVNYVDSQAASTRSLLAVTATSATASPWSPPTTGKAYKVLVSGEGIYRLTSTWLASKGVDVSAIDLGQVRLYNQGQEVAIQVYDQNGDGRFDAEDYIAFYGIPVAGTAAKYTRNNVYWLTTAGGSGEPSRMDAIDGAPGEGPLAGTHQYTLHYEQDELYVIMAAGTDAEDRWFFSTTVPGPGVVTDNGQEGGKPFDFSISVPGAAGAGSLQIRMYGTSDLTHRVNVSVNGSAVGTVTWKGKAYYVATLAGVELRDGANTVTLTCQSGTSSLPDEIAVDWFEIVYPRNFMATGNALRFSHDSGARYQVAGFADSSILAFDITSPANPVRIANTAVGAGAAGTYSLEMEPQGTGERVYLAVSEGGVKTPVDLIQDVPSSLSDPANGADYLLIAPRDLGWDAQGAPRDWLNKLLALRQAQGLRVKAVDVTDICDEFGYGVNSPQAIKDFLTYAYANWTSPAPRYVLLAGDGTNDPKNNQGREESSFAYLPTYLGFTQYMGETAMDDWYGQVSGGDILSDLYIGRLPAATVDQAAAMVDKIVAYEQAANSKGWEKNTLFVAGRQAEAYEGIFESTNEEAAALIPAGMGAATEMYVGKNYATATALNTAFKDRLNNAGSLIVNYSGHASWQLWGDVNEQYFSNGDVAGLTNSRLPFFVGMTCLSGYFLDPESFGYPSLTEALLRAAGKGAVAAFMPTGMMNLLDNERILDAALFESLFSKDIRTLGPAIAAAKETLMANGSEYAETSETFLLFGDPAMRLKIPLPTIPTGLAIQLRNGNETLATLSWQAALDCQGGAVSGYNVYRAATPRGSATKLNEGLITDTAFKVTHNEGESWYYLVASVDGDGLESGPGQGVLVDTSFKGEIKGDLDNDGKTDLADAIIALKALSGLGDTVYIRPDYVTSGADVNGDNLVGIEEAVYILEKVGGMR